jgi:hypothetical protein
MAKTKRAIQRKAFEKEYRKVYGVSAKVAREARVLFERHTLEDATKKLLLEHPRIAKSKVGPAKAAVTRKAKSKGIGGGEGGVGPVSEYIVAMTYGPSGRSFDVIVTARTESEAYNIAWQFLKDDEKARRVADSIPAAPLNANLKAEINRTGELRTRANWIVQVPRAGTKPEATEEDVGNAEYRDASKANKKAG